jgi:transposase
MTLHPRDRFKIPTNTVRVARAAFPKGNVYMTMRDELELHYEDSDYKDLFTSPQGRPAESPGMLCLVTVMQYAEGLTDRQTAEMVRARMDWKYALGLALEDEGFHFSVLSSFRDRVIAGGAERRLLDDMLQQFKDKGLLKARGKQRTDSTAVLAAVRSINRLECIGETLRAALNALAAAAPTWLLEQVTPDWFERYGERFEQYRLPRKRSERQALGETIGADGYHLLMAIYEEDAPPWLREIEAVGILRQVWIQQFCVQEGQVKLRSTKDLPPNKQLIMSPYDVDARSRVKRGTQWTGYAVHLTETCDAKRPNLITHVETTPATTGDVEMTDTIHQALQEKDLLPGEHLVDTAYVSAEHLARSSKDYELDLCGPAPPDSTWQARSETGYDIPCFAIDWEAQSVTCPQGIASRSWHEREEKDKPVIQVRFPTGACRACGMRSCCTHAKEGPRVLTIKPQTQHEALQEARQRQQTSEFKERYKARAGVEGTISQGTRTFGLRRTRYIGLPKTRLGHILTAAAIDLTRAVHWLMDPDPSKAHTRVSHFAALAPAT